MTGTRFSVLKVAIIVFLVPFCIYILFLIFSHTKRSPANEESRSTEERTGVANIEKFEMKGLDQGQESFNLNAEKFIQLDDGTFKLEKIHSLVLYNSDRQKVTLSADRGSMLETDGKDRRITAEGNVLCHLEDGSELRSERLVFDQQDQTVRSDRQVTIIKDSIEAHASSMSYDLRSKEVLLSHPFTMELRRDGGTVRVTSSQFLGDMSFRQGILSGGVVIKDARSELRAPEAKIAAARDGAKLEHVTLSGGVQGTALLQRDGRNIFCTMSSDSMDVMFRDNESTHMMLAANVFLKLQNSKTDPSEVETALCDRLEVERNPDKYTTVRMNGNVRVRRERDVMAARSDEQLSCDSLSIDLSPLQKADSSHAAGKVRYLSGDLQAESEEASFDGTSSRVVLNERGGIRPVLVTHDWTVYAERIEIDGQSDVSASGNVKSSYASAEELEDRVPLFDDSKMLFIASDSLSVRDENKVLYTGNVRAWQEENSISSDELSLDLDKKVMEASGRVVSRFSNIATFGKDEEDLEVHERSSRTAEIESESVWYSSAEKRALYRGNVVMKMESSELECNEMEVIFSEAGKAEKMNALYDVRLKTEDFSSTGHAVEYTPADERAVIRGNSDPIRVYDRYGKEVIIAPSLTFHMSDDKMSSISREGGRTWIILE